MQKGVQINYDTMKIGFINDPDDPSNSVKPSGLNQGGIPSWVGLLIVGICFITAGVTVIYCQRRNKLV